VIQFSKETDERREAGPLECWCLHGAVGMAADWRPLAKSLAAAAIGTRAVDLWRLLECSSLPLAEFGKTFNAEASGQVFRGSSRALLGYSMGGRLALHALLEPAQPWQAAVIVAADPGLESNAARLERRNRDATWATQLLTHSWPQFLAAWEAQAVLGNAAIRDAAATASLSNRRREMARSFVDWSLGAQESLWDRLPGIQIPVLWIVGENDAKFLALARRAVPLIPHARLAIASTAGHRVPWEQPAWFTDQVAHFLKTGS
jgi:2-succinyl-6-hydroxy-2,4-cyclohexadiene-1-carboxylate synthase